MGKWDEAMRTDQIDKKDQLVPVRALFQSRQNHAGNREMRVLDELTRSCDYAAYGANWLEGRRAA